MEGPTPLAGKQMSPCSICNLDPPFVSRLWLNDGNPVPSIRCCDTAIRLCCHINCLGSARSKHRVLPFCLYSRQPPRGSRPLLPDASAGTITVSSHRVGVHRPQHNGGHFLKITLVTFLPPHRPTATTELERSCGKSPQSVKITGGHLLRSSEIEPAHTAPLRAAAQFHIDMGSLLVPALR